MTKWTMRHRRLRVGDSIDGEIIPIEVFGRQVVKKGEPPVVDLLYLERVEI